MPATIHRGELYWIASDETGSPAHPHLVVQDDVFNHSRVHTVLVCALTSNLHKAKDPGNVLLDPGEGGLERQSVVVVSQIGSIEKARLGERIGALSQARVDEVIEGLRFLERSFWSR